MPNFTLYKFQIALSNIARNRYEAIEFRAAKHPSESMPYFLTRILAFALNYEEDLSFAATGLHDPDAAAIHIPDLSGGFNTLIEIGSPSARKLHKATKNAETVKVYTYKNPDKLLQEILAEKVHRASEIEVFSFSSAFLSEIEPFLRISNRWDLVFNDGIVSIQIGEVTVSGELSTHSCG